MSEWKTVRLGDVCEKGSSNIAQNEIADNNGEYPIYGAAGFIKNVDFYKQDKPYIGIVKDGAGVGRVSVHPAKSSLIGTMQYIFPKENIDIKFLAEFLKYQNLSRFYTGATIPHIYFKDYQNIPLKLPSLQKQKHISAVLDKCTELIVKNKRILEKYDTLIKSRFIEMFGDISTGNYKFETRKLGSVSEVGSSHRVFTTEFVEQGVPFYRGTEIGMLANGQQPEEPFYISEEQYNRLTEHDSKPKIGDLLMPSICNKGQVWMVDTESPFYYKDGRVLSISPNQKIYNSKYLQYFMREKTIVEYPKLGSGSTFAEFKIFLLKDIDVLTPPISLQNDFAAFVQQIDKSKFAVQKSLEKAETLYKSLMQEYFG